MDMNAARIFAPWSIRLPEAKHKAAVSTKEPALT
jgi:hypothetical protein